MLEASATGSVFAEDRQVEQLPQFLMFCNQQGNIFPGGRASQPIEEQGVGALALGRVALW